MPNPATAIFRQIKYKVESAYGTIPTPLTGSQAIRRVEFSPDLSKDTYQSNELRIDQQVADFRHGARRASGTLKGELSPKAYADFLAALLRKAWATTTSLTGLSSTLAIDGAHPDYTLSGTGFLTGNTVKAGDVIRITAGTWTDQINVNLLVKDVTSATSLKVTPLNGKTLTPAGPIAGTTITIVGKKVWVPATGHLDLSYTIESWFSDLVKSEMYTGMKPVRAALSLPSTGMATIDMEFAGQNVTTYSAEQFTSPTAAPAFGVAAAVNGLLTYGGTRQTAVRDLSININGNFGGSPVVGSNAVPFQFPGRVTVDGQFTAFFDSTTLRDAFLAETEAALTVVLSSDNQDTSDFIGITLPRIKVGSASKNDAQDGIVQTFSFQALYQATGGSGNKFDQTTISIQDSQAP
jgi:hypothetical protein